MLKHLFISKVRVKVLEQFFLNPKEEYHVRGLVRILDEEINAIRRELINLEACGILKSRKITNKIAYSMNQDTSIYEELRGMVLKNCSLGLKVGKIARDAGKVEAVILSHSYLYNKYDSDSDLDFLFIGSFDIRKLGSGMKEFEAETQREYKYTAITMKDFEFGKKKRSSFIVNIIENDFVVICGSFRKLLM